VICMPEAMIDWVEMASVIEPQINAEGIHNYPFAPSFPIDVRLFSSDSRYRKRMNRHSYLEVFHVTRGDTRVQVQDRVLPAQEGDLLVIGNNLYHRILGLPNSRNQYTLMFFQPGLINCEHAEDAEYVLPFLGQSATFPHVVPASTGIPEEVLGLMRRIKAQLPVSSVLARLQVMTFLKMSLVLLAKYYADLQVTQDISRRRKEIDRLDPLFRSLDKRCDEAFRVNDAASMVDLSSSHFMNFFKRATGQSFITYLNHFRVAKAQALLATSEKSISEISRIVGFCNQSYFGMVFRRTVGATPLAFRRDCGRLLKVQPSQGSILHGGDAELIAREHP
jgi:AraC family transcriptional regulator, transcriptional activator of pobA